MENYRVLQWNGSFDGPWSDNAENRYREGGFDGLILSPSKTWVPPDLEFLHRLHGLRFFSLRARVKKDVAAFEILTLEELALVTGSQMRIPDTKQPALRRLTLTDRPGVAVAAHWPALDSFRLGTWRGTNLRILEGAKKLVRLHVEGRRQAGTLDGLKECESLEELVTVNYSVQDTGPLRSLNSLVELKLMAAHPTAGHGRIDFTDIRRSRLRKLWISNAGNIQNVEALAGISSLRELRLVDCRLSSEDREFLRALPGVRVQLVTLRK